MKIDLRPVAEPLAVSTKGTPTNPAPTKDRVSLEKTDGLREAIRRAQASSGASRAAQLHALEQQIANGTYQPSASRLAQKLLSAALTDAQLIALLSRP